MRQRRIVTLLRSHTSQLRGDHGRSLSSTIRHTNEEALIRPPHNSSKGSSARSQRVIRAELCGRRSWPTLCLLSRIRGRQQEDSAPALLRTRPPASTLQMIVAVEHQFSCIFPAHPRSLASVLIPRPAARRVSASAYAALRVSAFKKSLCNERKKIFRTFRKRHRLALGSEAHSRRFAQECPEANPGKYNKEK
jgi:hypothetical protein